MLLTQTNKVAAQEICSHIIPQFDYLRDWNEGQFSLAVQAIYERYTLDI